MDSGQGLTVKVLFCKILLSHFGIYFHKKEQVQSVSSLMSTLYMEKINVKCKDNFYMNDKIYSMLSRHDMLLFSKCKYKVIVYLHLIINEMYDNRTYTYLIMRQWCHVAPTRGYDPGVGRQHQNSQLS